MFRSGLAIVGAVAVAAALIILTATPASARPGHHGGRHGGGDYYGGSYEGSPGYGGYGPSYGGGYSPYGGYASARPYYSPGYGGMAGYNYGPDAYSLNFPGRSTTQSFYGPSDALLTPASDVAQVQIRVADPNAELWFNDTPMRQRGAWRSFESPTLTPGKDYTYDTRVRWTDPASGATKEETRKITIHAGDRLVMDFTRPAQ
jgi:uncharacterized protein (TIGR03000 family)